MLRIWCSSWTKHRFTIGLFWVTSCRRLYGIHCRISSRHGSGTTSPEPYFTSSPAFSGASTSITSNSTFISPKVICFYYRTLVITSILLLSDWFLSEFQFKEKFFFSLVWIYFVFRCYSDKKGYAFANLCGNEGDALVHSASNCIWVYDRKWLDQMLLKSRRSQLDPLLCFNRDISCFSRVWYLLDAQRASWH